MRSTRLFYILIFIVLSMIVLPTSASLQEPIYIVNGVEWESIKDIPVENIESTDDLPINDQLIAKYGVRANNGVMIITLKHEKYASFQDGASFSEYIASRVEWGDDEVAANIILRYIIKANGELEIDKELSSTDSRFKRRVLKVIAEAPKWTPAMKNGEPIDSEGVLNILLPKGKQLPREFELVIR